MALRQITTAQSTNIAAVYYDNDTGDMYVQFVRQNTLPYRFKQIPILTAEGFERANSAGQYFRGNVLHQYDHEVVPSVPGVDG